ncbi:MAG: hypothetical protein ACRDKL_09435 [Solirubrobacteraceae bacterium]
MKLAHVKIATAGCRARQSRASRPRHRQRATRLLALLGVAVLAIGLSGCGRKTLTGVTEVQYSAGIEPYFNVGDVTYQLQISRQLNPFSYNDVQYLAGVKGAQEIAADQLWFGIFLWAKNQTKQTRDSSGRFELLDSAGRVYHPTPLNPSVNPYAWTAQPLSQNEIEPAAGSIAGDGSPGGSLILFKVNQSIYSNRPLTLEIFGPPHAAPAKVSLDL